MAMPIDGGLSGETPSLLIFGISGATWDFITPMIAEGRLPNLARLCKEGVSGVLMSEKAEGDEHYRPQIAWTSLATGCSSERHGLTRYFHTADDIRCPTFWDLLQERGYRVGLYGWPMTWPPRPIDGFVIPCHHARDSRTWPPELSELKDLDRRRTRAAKRRSPSQMLRASEAVRIGSILGRFGGLGQSAPALIRDAIRVSLARDPEQRAMVLAGAKLRLSTPLFLGLLRSYRPEVCAFVTFLVDYISHRYWRYQDPDKFPDTARERVPIFATAVSEAYEQVDRALGALRAALPRRHLIAVVSEHGMSGEPDSPEVGPWQYLIRGERVLDFLGLDQQILVCPIARWVAFRPLAGTELPGDMAERLRKLVIVETGLPLFQVHRHREEVVIKLFLEPGVKRYQESSLESLQIQYEGRETSFRDLTMRGGRRRSAMHARDGIFILQGEGVKQGVLLEPARLVDVVPTLLSRFGPFQGNETKFDGVPLDVFESTDSLVQ